MPDRRPVIARALLVGYAVVALASVVGNSVVEGVLGTWSTPLLLLLLLAWVVVTRGAMAPRLLVVGMVFAWLGDVALDGPGDLRFMLGLASFLLMQVCYSAGFIRMGALPVLRRRWWIPVLAAALWLALNLVLGPQLGDLRLPLAVYSAALVAMATLSLAISTQIGVGGVLFLVSDLLIGLNAAGIDFPGRGALVMATYALAQLLIVTGWVARDVAARDSVSAREV